jgi:uncharacterized protein (DUF1697 family)
MRYIAFLRGINVSGQKLIKMDALKQHFELPGFKNIATYIQSGNVLFDARETEEEQLRKKIEKQLAVKLGYEVPTIIRSIDDIRKAIGNNPFADITEDKGRKLYITFLSSAPSSSVHTSLDSYANADEVVKVIGRELYIVSGGIGNSKLSLSLIEKKLGVAGTMRNWATVNKITEL